MEQIVCKNCGNHFTGKYCNNCGEKNYTEKDHSVIHLLEEGLHFITHLDGTLFTTLKTIFTKPRQMSLDYCNGTRKKYFKPVSFFLLLVILYLLFPVFEGLNMQLHFHEVHGLYGGYAKQEVAKILAKRNITELELSKSFHHAGEKISKFLLFIVIPAVGFVSWLLGSRKRKYFFDHFIFSTEMLSFFLMWGFLIFPLMLRLTQIIYHRFGMSEDQIGLIIYIPFSFILLLQPGDFLVLSVGIVSCTLFYFVYL